MKNPDKMTWSRAFRANVRGVKIWYQNDPQMIQSTTAKALWDALSPYVVIYLSAQIVEALSAGADAARVWNLVLITLASSALIALVTAFLQKWYNIRVESGVAFDNSARIISKKVLSMDFVDADDAKTHEKLSQIEAYKNSQSLGLNHLPFDWYGLLSSLFTGIGGIALTVSLFTSRVPDAAVQLFFHVWTRL